MKKAIGRATTASITVTDTAMPSVRTATVRYCGSVSSDRKLSSVQCCSTAEVNALVVQNADSSRTASEPRYASTSQVIGAASSAASRRPGRRSSSPASRRIGVRVGARVGVCAGVRAAAGALTSS